MRLSTRSIAMTAASALLLLLVMQLSISAGELTNREAFLAVFGVGEDHAIRSVQSRRLPRLLSAMGVGAALGVAGAVFQSITRNPLGSPDIIGFSTGAATAATIYIATTGSSHVLSVGVAAIVGGFLTAVVVFVLARRRRATDSFRLILVGIAVGAFLGAIRDLLLLRVDISVASKVQIWQAGSLSGRGYEHATLILFVSGFVISVLVLLQRRLFLLEFGDEIAGALGISVEKLRLSAMLLAIVLVGVATAVAGPIAFVALAAPHIARGLTRTTHIPLVMTAIVGALLLVAADYLTQHAHLGLRTPIGLVTSLLGGVYLMWLVRRL